LVTIKRTKFKLSPENKYLYRRRKGAVPEGDEIVPIGVAATRCEGNDITLLTYGAMVTPSLEAADRLSTEGVEVDVDVIDLRTLLPFDKDAIFRSVEETNRVLVVHEDVKTLGIGAELSAVIMEDRFDSLDAPVMRVTNRTRTSRSRRCSRWPTCPTQARSRTRCGGAQPINAFFTMLSRVDRPILTTLEKRSRVSPEKRRDAEHHIFCGSASRWRSPKIAASASSRSVYRKEKPSRSAFAGTAR